MSKGINADDDSARIKYSIMYGMEADIAPADDPRFVFQPYYTNFRALCGRLPDGEQTHLLESIAAAQSHEYRITALSYIASKYLRRIILLDRVRPFQEERRSPVAGKWFTYWGLVNFGDGPDVSSPWNGYLDADEASRRLKFTLNPEHLYSNSGRFDGSHTCLALCRFRSANRIEVLAYGMRDFIGGRRDGEVVEWFEGIAPASPAGDALLGVPATAAELDAFTNDRINDFGKMLERSSYSRLAYAGQEVQPERVHQALFFLSASPVSSLSSVGLDPETNHGDGNVDFLVRAGSECVAVEFKLASNTRLSKGLEVQLPRYMEAAGARFGHYVVFCHDRDPPPDQVRRRLAKKLTATGSVSVRLHVFDVRTKPPASIAK